MKNNKNFKKVLVPVLTLGIGSFSSIILIKKLNNEIFLRNIQEMLYRFNQNKASMEYEKNNSKALTLK